MAKLFRFKPWEVDEIGFDFVLGMLSMEAHSRKKEYDQMKNKNGKRF